MIYGIDLGTTNSTVSRFINGEPHIISHPNKVSIIPSVVSFTESGEVIVGDEAKFLMSTGDKRSCAFFKMFMGEKDFEFIVDNEGYSAIELSAYVLKELKKIVKETIDQNLKQAVITVPAYFREPQRQATIQAGQLAGIDVVQVINEPTAAALAYTHNKKLPDKTRFIVYDLGGGTFDVTLIEIEGDKIKVLSSDGDHKLGGKDWDQRICESYLVRFEEEHDIDLLDEDIGIYSELMTISEDVKKTLQSRESTKFTFRHNGLKGSYVFTYQDLIDATQDLFNRTCLIVDKLLENKGLTSDDINAILLIGGSTRLKQIREGLASSYHCDIWSDVNPDEAVGLGAAIFGNKLNAINDQFSIGQSPQQQEIKYSLQALRFQDVTCHSLGLIAINDDYSAYENCRIITKDTTIPSREMRPFIQANDQLEIFLTQGEVSEPDGVTYLGLYKVDGLGNQKRVLNIEYIYDLSGVVNLSITDRDTGEAFQYEKFPIPEDIPARFMQRPPQPPPIPQLNIMIAIDLSGSMSGSPLAESKQAAIKFVRNLDLTCTKIAVNGFADNVLTTLNYSNDINQIERHINKLEVGLVGIGNEAEPFTDFLSKSQDKIKNLSSKLLGLLSGASDSKSTMEQRYIMLLLTDGVWYNPEKAISVANTVKKQGHEIIAIGFGGADEDFLNQISSSRDMAILTTQSQLSNTFSSIAQVLMN